MFQLFLGQVPFASDPIHNLDVFRITGEGAQEPITPFQGLGFVAMGQHGFKGQGSVA